MRTPSGWAAVEALEVGDLVLSRDEHNANGPVEAKVVEELFVRFGQVMWLTVAGRRIGTTSEHPFWVVGKGWLPAGDLSVGDRLVGIDGQTVCVEAKEPGEYATLYNLRIADWHTDFVGCAEWGWEVWAHNACDVEAQTNIADLETAEQARIDELIAKAAKSKDPGLADTVTILKGYGVQIKDVNHYIGSPPSEVDIGLMNGTIVQVKILSSAAYLTEQLAAIEKATGQVVIGYVIVTQKRGRKSLTRANKLQQTELMA